MDNETTETFEVDQIVWFLGKFGDLYDKNPTTWVATVHEALGSGNYCVSDLHKMTEQLEEMWLSVQDHLWNE